jgi:hypothetical protein
LILFSIIEFQLTPPIMLAQDWREVDDPTGWYVQFQKKDLFLLD